MLNLNPRPIKSELKSYRINPEPEKPSRHSFLKLLREGTLREFYPDINPYAEAYKFRDNMWAIFTEGLTRGCGDMWNYLIEGPEKALLIDTGFGVGNLKALCEKLVNGKEIIVFDTHFHLDHVGGNLWFDKVYCHEYDKETIESQIREDFITKATLDENGKPKDTYYDVNDLPPFHKYEVIGIQNGYKFNLGKGYICEVVHLPGHTPGQSGIYDYQNKCLYIGDTTSAFGPRDGEKHPECCTINALRDALKKLQPRFDEISGVFPGHGMLDQTPVMLQYELDTLNQVIANPENYDKIRKMVRAGGPVDSCTKNIYQGTAVRYTPNNVYMYQQRRKKD